MPYSGPQHDPKRSSMWHRSSSLDNIKNSPTHPSDPTPLFFLNARNSRRRGPSRQGSFLHTPDNCLPNSKSFGHPRNCQGLKFKKGNITASVSGSYIEDGHEVCPIGMLNTKSEALCNCLRHKGVMSLGTMKMCNDSCRLCLAFLSCSTAAKAAHGAGAQTNTPGFRAGEVIMFSPVKS